MQPLKRVPRIAFLRREPTVPLARERLREGLAHQGSMLLPEWEGAGPSWLRLSTRQGSHRFGSDLASFCSVNLTTQVVGPEVDQRPRMSPGR